MNRERNKVLAQKTRSKKKAEFEFLREQMVKLQAENDELKYALFGNPLGPINANILLNTDFQIPDDINMLIQQMISSIEYMNPSLNKVKPTKYTNRAFCLTKATSLDHPIVYASPGFTTLTGFELHDVIGHNFQFLLGPETDRFQVRSYCRYRKTYHFFLILKFFLT